MTKVNILLKNNKHFVGHRDPSVSSNNQKFVAMDKTDKIDLILAFDVEYFMTRLGYFFMEEPQIPSFVNSKLSIAKKVEIALKHSERKKIYDETALNPNFKNTDKEKCEVLPMTKEQYENIESLVNHKFEEKRIIQNIKMMPNINPIQYLMKRQVELFESIDINMFSTWVNHSNFIPLVKNKEQVYDIIIFISFIKTFQWIENRLNERLESIKELNKVKETTPSVSEPKNELPTKQQLIGKKDLMSVPIKTEIINFVRYYGNEFFTHLSKGELENILSHLFGGDSTDNIGKALNEQKKPKESMTEFKEKYSKFLRTKPPKFRN